MVCPKCKNEMKDESAFCTKCGYDFSSDNIMDALDADKKEEKKNKKEDKKEKKLSLFKGKKKDDGSDKKRRSFIIKAVLIAVAAIAVVVGVLLIISLVSANEGRKILNNIPIGRDLAYAESKTGKDFVLISRHDALQVICPFDGVYESENAIKAEGINLPEWAVTVSIASDNTINKASYYDFSQLQSTWKGQSCAAEIPITTVEYGMTDKEVEKKIGFKPYAIVKEINNTVTYVYRYYYEDNLTGNDVVNNFYVVFDDVDGNVADVFAENIAYTEVLMSVK